uniref:Uncharacterized protein n=1 Tax=Strongyloides venezuelensis TaxID=75913 RepID=A0A0K0FKR7_STRVS
MFFSYNYTSCIIGLGFFFLTLPIFSFGFKSQTIFLNIPHFKDVTSTLGFECFALFFFGEGLSYLFAEISVYYVGYRIILKLTGLITCLFFYLTLYGDIFLIHTGAFLTGIAIGHMWISQVYFLNYSRSHPWYTYISKTLLYMSIFTTLLLPLIGIGSKLPDKVPIELKSPAMMNDNMYFEPEIFINVKNVMLAKIFYEHLLEYLIFALIGTFLLCVQPRLWKIVGIKVNNDGQLKLTLVDYNNKKDDFSKSINELYKGKRIAITTTWKTDIKNIPYIIFNQFMIIGYFPVIYVGSLTGYICSLLTSGTNYGDVERDLDVESSYISLIIVFICIGRAATQYWVSGLNKVKYNKNRRRNFFALIFTLTGFFIISLSDALLPVEKVDLVYGIIKNKFSDKLKMLIFVRLFGIAILSVANVLSEYYIYGYFEILGQEFGSKVIYIIRILHCVSLSFFVITFQFIPEYMLPLLISIFAFIATINFSKAEKYLIRSIFITQGVSQTTITKNG